MPSSSQSVTEESAGLTTALGQVNINGGSIFESALEDAELASKQHGIKEDTLKLEVRSLEHKLESCELSCRLKTKRHQLNQVSHKKFEQDQIVTVCRDQMGLPPPPVNVPSKIRARFQPSGNGDDMSRVSMGSTNVFGRRASRGNRGTPSPSLGRVDEDQMDAESQVPSQKSVKSRKSKSDMSIDLQEDLNYGFNVQSNVHSEGNPIDVAFVILTDCLPNKTVTRGNFTWMLRDASSEQCADIVDHMVDSGYHNNINNGSHDLRAYAHNGKVLRDKKNRPISMTKKVTVRIIKDAFGI